MSARSRSWPSSLARRHTTVLFCDLVDSTRLSGVLDPEDLQEVLLAFRDVARKVIVGHGGFLASYMGDGVLALFAYPRAHEDDPQRAVRAGLELVEAIRALRPRPGIELHSRVGIATGVVVVGPVLGSGDSHEDVAVGQTTNLAARLQGFASADSVVIAAATKRLVESTFECVRSGVHEMKGFDEPVEVWRALRERTDQDESLRPARSAPAIPLVGRDAELSKLSAAWREARAGKGQLVVVQGEPGVGKSRLVGELSRALSGEPHVVFRYGCGARFQNSALFPIIRQLERAAGFAPDDTIEQKLDRIEAFVERVRQPGDEPGLARVIAGLLSVPFGKRYPPLVESPERWKRRTFDALKEHTYATARQTPVLVVIEDVQWSDPTTLELVNEMLAGIGELPVFVVATVRPGFGELLPRCATTTLLDLERLGLAHAKTMLSHVAGERSLPEAVIEHVLEKGEGVPLFIEEFTKALLDSEAYGPGKDGPHGPRLDSIPSTLQDSLAARLDRLSAVKEVVQVAATIGREFPCDLLADVLALAPAELDSTLDTLVAADLIRLSSGAARVGRFKHLLLQEAAYSMMLRSNRRELHLRVSSVLAARRVAGHGVDAVVMAHHCIEGGETQRGIGFLEEAATLASTRAAHTEARGHLLRALELLSRADAAPERDEAEVRLSVGLGLATSATQGYAAPEVEAAYQRSLDLCLRLGHHPSLFPALRGLCTFYIVRAALGTAREIGEECLRVAEESGNPADLIESATALGYTIVYQGDLARGRAHLERAVALYRAHDGQKLSYPSLQDPAVASLGLLAIVSFITGDAVAAERWQRDALELADMLESPFNRAYARTFASLHYGIAKSFTLAIEQANSAVQVAEEYGFPVWIGAATMHGTIARGNTGGAEPAIAVLKHMLALWQAGGAELNRPYFLLGLAQCHWAAGQAEEALDVLGQAFEHSKRSGEAWTSPELHRMRGEILRAMRPNEHKLYRTELERAVTLAREQGASVFELRALRAGGPYAPGSPELTRIEELVSGIRSTGAPVELGASPMTTAP